MGRVPFIYRHPWLYAAVMRGLHGPADYRRRYTEIARRVPPGCTVVDVCCGDCRLYQDFLRGHAGGYTGLDISPAFVAGAVRRGINASVFDFAADPVPEADVVIMQAAFYHFSADAPAALAKLRRAARQRVILAEPVVNLSTAGPAPLRWIARSLTVMGRQDSSPGFRYTPESFAAFCRSVPGCTGPESYAGGREMIAIFEPS